MAKREFKIFKANRIKFQELYNDAFEYIRAVYNANGKEFTMASPFAQIVTVLLHLGRMILFYIENSITELNIRTAYHPRSIQGLATLTGHIPSSGISARGTLYMSYKNNGNYLGKNISINNFTRIQNTANGLTYLAVLPSNSMQLTVGAYDSKVEISIIQGDIHYQRVTGTGNALQSYHFSLKPGSYLDNFFINVYVNGESWENVPSILDMTYKQKACIIRNSIDGGIDVFFGTNNNGAIPEEGASIVCEYILSDGYNGNILSDEDDNYWSFEDPGYDSEGDYVDLNSLYTLTSGSDIVFGMYGESLEMTRQLAPHMSRSFVLANEVNYRTFLSKLNIFSKIHVFSGFHTYTDSKAEIDYENAKVEYSSLKESYLSQVNLTGKNSRAALDLYDKVLEAKKQVDLTKRIFNESREDDNVIYMYLIPDITKRISGNENYFTCPQSVFSLTKDEKEGILNLIDNSGQKMLTVENRIIDPIFVKFAVNIFIQMWSDYDFNAVKSSIIAAVSDYLIKNDRRDRIPISDIISVVEAVDGVDSVTAFFDADKNNSVYYGKGKYGIDDYGDIILERDVKGVFGTNIYTNDLYPMFRGPFTSAEGIEYSDSIESLVSPINITLRGKTRRTNK
jgi:hypothetical protein